MNKEMKKRVFTSVLLISLLIAMNFYSYIMITALVVISIILWIEFYALISKILKKNLPLIAAVFSLDIRDLEELSCGSSPRNNLILDAP